MFPTCARFRIELKAGRDKVDHSGKLNVGLVWAGSPTHLGDRFRSLTLERLAPLLRTEGACFHSLQKGPAAAELNEVTDDIRT